MNESGEAQPPIVVALAGQPNIGKSTVFNLLTGLNQHIGHWPGKTVARTGRLLTILLAPLVPCSARLAVPARRAG